MLGELTFEKPFWIATPPVVWGPTPNSTIAGLVFRMSFVLDKPCSCIATGSIEIKAEPTGATPRMRVPVTMTSFSSAVDAASGAAA